jgi:hypothetical protein
VLKSEGKESESLDRETIEKIVSDGLDEINEDSTLTLSETEIIPEIVKKINVPEEEKTEITKRLTETMEKIEDESFTSEKKELIFEKTQGKISEKESEEIINKIIESKNPEKTIKELNKNINKKLPKNLTTEITSEVLIPVATKIEIEIEILKSQKVIDQITNENTKTIADSIEKILKKLLKMDWKK